VLVEVDVLVDDDVDVEVDVVDVLVEEHVPHMTGHSFWTSSLKIWFSFVHHSTWPSHSSGSSTKLQ
jgi:hypothetical protein